MEQTYPIQDRICVRDEELHVNRRFGAESKINVRTGQRVGPGDLLGTIAPHRAAVRVNLARDLYIAPDQVVRHLNAAVGSRIEQGAPLVKIRRGLRNQVVPAPVTGELIDVDERSGSAMILPDGANEVRALVPGDVTTVIDHSSVVIRTVGTRILGTIGIGQPAAAPLFVLPPDNGQGSSSDQISAKAAQRVVVAPEPLTTESLQNLMSLNVAGVITGSLEPELLASVFGWRHDDQLAPWRATPTDYRIGSAAQVPFPLLATEGFGTVPMNKLLHDVLRTHDGKSAAVFTETSPIAPRTFPEVIVADTARLDHDAPVTVAEIRPGTLLRLVRAGQPGLEATAVGTPFRHRFGDSHVLDAVDVQIGSDSRETIPVASVEIIA
jgi:hypothetical protein